MGEWRQVVNWPNYEVSDGGDVRRKGGQVLKPGFDKKTGYLKVALCDPSIRQITKNVHQLVAEAFIGPRPEGAEVNHMDTNKRNNTAANLEYVTHLENVRHAQAHGLDLRGEKNGSAKLTAVQVLEARRLHKEKGHNAQQLARQFHVTYTSMRDILRRKNWSHLKDN